MSKKRKSRFLRRVAIFGLTGSLLCQFGSCGIDDLQEQAAAGLVSIAAGLFNIVATDIANQLFGLE
jgi:hypothetical protein